MNLTTWSLGIYALGVLLGLLAPIEPAEDRKTTKIIMATIAAVLLVVSLI